MSEWLNEQSIGQAHGRCGRRAGDVGSKQEGQQGQRLDGEQHDETLRLLSICIETLRRYKTMMEQRGAALVRQTLTRNAVTVSVRCSE